MISAEIQAVNIDENGNVKVRTNYIRNSTVIQQGHTRYSFGALATIEEIQNLILKDIKIHCENLIKRMFVKNKNADELNSLQAWAQGKKHEAISGKLIVGNTEFTVNETSVISQKPKEVI